jgi:hypothetical protein
MGKLHVSIDHGGQRVEFDSPGTEGNPGIGLDGDLVYDFGDDFGILGLGKAVRSATKGVARFTRSAANAAGHGAHTLTRVTDKVTGEVTDAARRVPVVGKPLRAAVGATVEPVRLATSLASGRRIDRAVVDSFRRSVREARTLAPYAQLVVSAVPGIGTGLSAAMAGGLVLAEGRPVNEAAVAAARAAVPGGPMAVAAFDAAVAVGSGKPVSDAAVAAAVANAAPDQRSRERIRGALEVAGGVARGKPIDKVALTAAAHALAPEARTRAEAVVGKPGAQEAVYDELVAAVPASVSRATVAGLALGFAMEDQRDLHAAVTSAAGRAALVKAGSEVVAKSDVLRTAAKDVPDRAAFDLGMGLMRHGEVTEPAVAYLRDSLTPRGKVSFDAALAVHVGAVSNPRLTAGTRYKVGYYAVTGSVAGSREQREGIVKLLSKNPEAKSGAASAVRAVRRRRSWWRRMVAWLTTKQGSV